jgi:hypothetical protein
VTASRRQPARLFERLSDRRFIMALLGTNIGGRVSRLLPSAALLAAFAATVRIDANETQIERAGVDLLSYTSPGHDHIVLTDGPFYTETVNDEKLVDWVTRVIERKPVHDVHCQHCRAG